MIGFVFLGVGGRCFGSGGAFGRLRLGGMVVLLKARAASKGVFDLLPLDVMFSLRDMGAFGWTGSWLLVMCGGMWFIGRWLEWFPTGRSRRGLRLGWRRLGSLVNR